MLTDTELGVLREELISAFPDVLERFVRTFEMTDEGGREASWSLEGTTACRLLPGSPRWVRQELAGDYSLRATRVVLPSDFGLEVGDRVVIDEVFYDVREVPEPRAWRLTKLAWLERLEEEEEAE